MLPKLTIRGRTLDSPIIQGGMGIGVSLEPLASTVAREGGAGIISSAALNMIFSKKHCEKISSYDAMLEEVINARYNAQNTGAVGVNIMTYIVKDYAQSVRGAVAGGADMIISGAGLPLQLPTLVGNANIALIPIVSSLRALKIIHKRWLKKGRCIDAVVVEGPLAGGHLGFKVEQINDENFSLEKIFDPIKDFAQKNGNFPVIVAGGVYSHSDILYWIDRGANGVQMGTRFLATKESTADDDFKAAVVNCTRDDIIISHPDTNPPGSPSTMPFRLIKQSPMFCSERKSLCNKGAVLQQDKSGKYTKCLAKEEPKKHFCICNGLMSSAGYESREKPLWTVGSNAWRINKLLSVHELMDELKGI